VAGSAAICAGLIAACFSTPWSPWAGLIVGPLVGLVVLLRHTRLLISLSAVGLVVAAGVYVALGQADNHYTVGAAWPSHFEPAAVMASVACLLLGADVLAERVRAARAGRMSGGAASGGPPSGGPMSRGPMSRGPASSTRRPRRRGSHSPSPPS